MKSFDEIPELPEPLPHELKEEEMTWEEFTNAKNRILIYTAPDGEPRIRFDGLNAECYANGVAILSAPWNKKACEHLKLILEGVRLVQVETKKSFETAIRVEKFIHTKNENNETNLG